MSNVGKKSQLTKQRILKAAILEFALMGYMHVSTNKIAEMAGVSKGVVFHYFGNKKKLYMSCFESAYNTFSDYLVGNPKILNLTDLFERMYYIGTLKQEFYLQNEALSALIFEASKLPDRDEYKDIKDMALAYTQKLYELFLNNINMDDFKPIYRNYETLNFIISVLFHYFKGVEKRYGDNIAYAISDYDNILAESKKLMDLLKYGVYVENKGPEIT
ncbi:MAG: TetR/AcrR family transcriptional regulator [Clostridiales bacterium]|nr:TetR/AcrR family transcriptional regulator [Clostridiales bacterium]